MKSKTTRIIVTTMLAVVALSGNAIATTTNRVYSTNQTVGGVEMTPEQQLVYAVTNAAAGDVVLIKPGKYTFSGTVYSSTETVSGKTVTNLLDSAKRVSIIGDTDLSRKDWSDGAEPVIIDVSGKGRLFKLQATNCSVHNLTVTGCTYPGANGFICQGGWDAYPVFTNCVFRNTSGNDFAFHRGQYVSLLYDCAYTNNSAYLSGGKGVYGCDFIGNTRCFYDMKAYGCRFEANSSTWYLDNPLVLSNCSFVACKRGALGIIQLTSEQATQISDCVFEKNTNVLIRAAFKESNSACVEVSRCTFTSNVVADVATLWHDWWMGYLVYNATNNFASLDAAQSKFSIIDSTFVDSSYTAGRGMTEICFVNARGCKFKPYASYLYNDWNALNVSAMDSRLQACEIAGGAVVNCVVDRCEVHDVPSDAYSCFRDYCRVTNTLVARCSAHIFGAVYGHDAEFVNCTFATNSGLTYIANAARSLSGDVKLLNCLFNSNVRGAAASDISINNDDKSLNGWTDQVSFGSSFYGNFSASGKLTAEVFAAKTGENKLEQCANPKFVKDSRPDASYWSLSPSSSLIGKGDASIWTAEDVDLAGKLRLKDSKVDPGCYQCWINPPGMAIFVR